MVNLKPSSKLILGSQFKIFFARLISGFLTFGSFSGSFLKIILLLDGIIFLIISTKFIMEYSTGFPMFTGFV